MSSARTRAPTRGPALALLLGTTLIGCFHLPPRPRIPHANPDYLDWPKSDDYGLFFSLEGARGLELLDGHGIYIAQGQGIREHDFDGRHRRTILSGVVWDMAPWGPDALALFIGDDPSLGSWSIWAVESHIISDPISTLASRHRSQVAGGTLLRIEDQRIVVSRHGEVAPRYTFDAEPNYRSMLRVSANGAVVAWQLGEGDTHFVRVQDGVEIAWGPEGSESTEGVVLSDDGRSALVHLDPWFEANRMAMVDLEHGTVKYVQDEGKAPETWEWADATFLDAQTLVFTGQYGVARYRIGEALPVRFAEYWTEEHRTTGSEYEKGWRVRGLPDGDVCALVGATVLCWRPRTGSASG